MKTSVSIKSLLLSVMTLIVLGAAGQTFTAKYISMSDNTGGYYEYLPQGYSKTEKYPLIIFIHGTGEVGAGTSSTLSKVANVGLGRLISQGKFPTSFTSGGKTHKFIVICPQFKSWPLSPQINNIIDYALANYSVNANRIYLTGLSMGGGATWGYAGDPAMYGARLAAIVPIAGASYPEGARSNRIADNKIPVWATHNDGDPTVTVTNTTGYIKNILARDPKANAKATIFSSSSHDAWTKTYDPSFREGGLNVYEWMLQWERGTNLTSANQPPVANAGEDKTITLPTNSLQLVGSATDPDGTIASMKWTKVSGPTTFSLSSLTTALTQVTNLLAGTYVFRLTVTDNKGTSTSDDVTITVKQNTTSATAVAIPATLQAESYVDFYGVQTESTKDVGGGLDVGWIDNNDWMDFKIKAPVQGTYTVRFRIATPNSGVKFQLRNSAGTVLTTVTLPVTGGYQTWQTVSASVTLPAGEQMIRVHSIAASRWNFNWLEFSQSQQASAPVAGGGTMTSLLQAENYVSSYGVQTENTKDAGGGLNVGWIDNNDWLDYKITTPSQGTYSIKFRISTPNPNVRFQIRNSAGTILSTVSVPVTGGYQAWQTITASVTLPAGEQVIRIHSIASLRWNINWLEISGGQQVAARTMAVDSASASSDAGAFEVYHNAEKQQALIKVDNSAIGLARIELIDESGAVKKQFRFYKDKSILQVYIPTSGISKGKYTLKISVEDWSESKEFVK